MCSKRAFDSEKAAKRAHRKAGFRLRAYRCADCGKVHVTNAEKRRGRDREDEDR